MKPTRKMTNIEGIYTISFKLDIRSLPVIPYGHTVYIKLNYQYQPTKQISDGEFEMSQL